MYCTSDGDGWQLRSGEIWAGIALQAFLKV